MRFKLKEKELEQILDKIASRFILKLQREIILRIPSRFRPRVKVEKTTNWRIIIEDLIFEYWELGVKPHDIDARFSKALKFVWEDHPADLPPSSDGFHYFKRVRHPGFKGKRILEEIANDDALLERLLKESINI